MTKFIFFSKTMYSETPRIRHQLADLLVSHGHKVVFYQKPLFFFEKKKKFVNQKISNNLKIKQTKQLLHHQLRLFSLLSSLNSSYEIQKIRSSLENIDESDVIINFNYDYIFLRSIFKKNKIITLINDDFVGQAKFNNGRHVIKSLIKVSEFSDAVLTVSYPLLKQVQQYNKRAELFLPWAEKNYVELPMKERNSILVWASINNVIDYEIIKNISLSFHNYKVFLIGPMDLKIQNFITELLKGFSNVFYLDPKTLEELDGIGDFFAALLPYRAGVKSTEAVTAANKTFRLMSLGLPLIVHGMPKFYEHEAIFKCTNLNEVKKSIEYCHSNFYNMQPSIKKLVNEQQPEQRYEQIMSIINEEKHNV